MASLVSANTTDDGESTPLPANGGTPVHIADPPVSTDLADISIPGDSLPEELSAMQMFNDADWVVKSVMLLLIGASVMSWTIAIAKSVELTRSQKSLVRQNSELAQTTTLGQATQNKILQTGTAHPIVTTVQDEIARSSPAGLNSPPLINGIKERAIARLTRLEGQRARQFALGTGPLASIGATAPFIGLFGTVWGIMNAFIGISQSQTTNLAVVAPGIAEALLATALGLVAAIPAVLIYNHFSRRIAALRGLLGDQSALVLQLLSRDLDLQQHQPPGSNLNEAPRP
jgi:biopolymer transport protein ExbB